MDRRDPAAAVPLVALTIEAGIMPHNLGSGLPNEILDAVFDHLPRDALTRVARVSRRWRANAERLLYASVIIHEILPRASPSPVPTSTSISPTTSTSSPSHRPRPWRAGAGAGAGAGGLIPAVPAATLRCCETLSARPHLAEYVRRFHVRWETDAVESPLFLLPIARNISQTLVPTLVNLHSLELSLGLASHLPALTTTPPLSLSQFPLDPPPPSLSPQLRLQLQLQPDQSYDAQCEHHHHHPHPHHRILPTSFRLPSLRTLALHGLGEPQTLELERVLRLHPTLLHLRLSDYQRPLRLTPADVPHLRYFRGHPATAASLLPGRPVQSLGLVGPAGEPPPSEEQLARIAGGSAPVRALDLSGMAVTPRLLRSLSRHLSHVEWLKVRLALRHTLHCALSGIVRGAFHFFYLKPFPSSRLFFFFLFLPCLITRITVSSRPFCFVFFFVFFFFGPGDTCIRKQIELTNPCSRALRPVFIFYF